MGADFAKQFFMCWYGCDDDDNDKYELNNYKTVYPIELANTQTSNKNDVIINISHNIVEAGEINEKYNIVEINEKYNIVEINEKHNIDEINEKHNIVEINEKHNIVEKKILDEIEEWDKYIVDYPNQDLV